MIQILKRRLYILIIIPVAAMFAAAIGSLILTPFYRSSATIMVAVTGEEGTASDYNSLILDRQLVKTYGALATAPDSLIEIASQLQGVSPSELANKITVTPVKDLELLKISVTDENPQRAAGIANKTVEVLRDKAESIYGSDYIIVIGSAGIPSEPENPGILMSVAAAAIAGLIIALIISFWLEDYASRKRYITKPQEPPETSLPG